MIEKPQCPSCKHNIKTTSCGSCVSKGSELVENIMKELELDIENPASEDPYSSYKNMCQIIMRYPEEYESVNPIKCKFYISSALRF